MGTEETELHCLLGGSAGPVDDARGVTSFRTIMRGCDSVVG